MTNMKRTLIAALILLLAVTAGAQGEDRVETSGGVTLGVQQVAIDQDSAKFNRFRDIRDGFYLYNLNLEGVDTQTGRFFDFRGQNLIRGDQEIDFGLGNFGIWRLDINRNEIPNRLSNKARTPFINQGDGVFTVPGLVPIDDLVEDPLAPGTFIKRGTPSLVPTTGQQAVNDDLVAEWLGTHLRHTDLGTQRKRTSAGLTVSPLDTFKFRITYSDERKEGSKITFGPIGDRPPRTLNIQFTEPIDYATRELRAEAIYTGARFQANLAYLLSDFENTIDTLIWQNAFFSPTGPDFIATVAGTPRHVSTFGRRALPPDNRYHNISGSFGIDLPMASRLTATAAYGWMKQDEALLPYSFSNLGSDWADPGKLPRANADAEINTTLLNVDYTVNPVARLNLRAFYRYYDLDNKTGSALWEYVTQDTANTNGTVGYRNFRINLPYAYDKQNYGLDARYTLAFWRTTLGLGYEREEIDRDFREADTDENIFRASLNTRPTGWILVRARYLYGDREAGGYNSEVTRQSYWYDFAQSPSGIGVDRDNPAFAFGNHPDLRKFDVSDRERNQFDISATVTPRQALDLTGTYSYRKDDFDSSVRPSQPLLNFPVDPAHPITDEDRVRATPGQQLGLLEEERQNFGIDAHHAPTERWSINAFANREVVESRIRGMVFNENRRENLGEIYDAGNLITALGPWDDPDRLFNAKLKDRTNTFGAGLGYEIIPARIRLSTDYTYSRGKLDLDYSGYGTQFEDTFQFAFRSPDTVRHNQYILNAALEFQLVRNLTFGLHYLFDRFKIRDWMQEPAGPWVETVGSEFFLRDTSRDNRWGNRLITMGSLLSPSYEAHVVSVTTTYRF
jgi:MtrB/PioB family decaheme-associated outer membrane protein